MTTHPSDDDLHDFAGGELAPRRRDEVAAHLEACAPCRAAARPLLALTARLAALPAAAEPAADPWPALHGRIAAEPGEARVPVAKVVSLAERRPRRALPAWAGRAAAAAVLLTVGFGGGRLSGTSDAGDAVLLAADTVATAVEAAARVDLAGTAYVAAVAQWVSAASGRDSVQTADGRAATIEACYGASRELTRLRTDDSSAVRLFRTAAAALYGTVPPDTPRISAMF
ncbi:MAG TPA: zf-HC2 domain-containing protein [Longimicrobium sp.]|nr:zf-HC2 domain-containing protein [Longimicrobium sp.]